MPRRKKQPEEWTTDEAMRKLFHPKVVKHAKKLAGREEKPQAKPPKQSE
ncbi:MAG TPA: hypothetical protein VF972_08695 [Actinomycetota bacterium]